jgi:hypothetical protein
LRYSPRHRPLGDRGVDFAALVARCDTAMIQLLLIAASVATAFALGFLLGHEVSLKGHDWRP